ncbi:PREDICTED: uncharacterized protein LOC104789922 isoform X2 [Camelina sativa]|uniref:Uncharacterized protein LOC104789922 isoform X2 n=1 Tax=Camelina sativa TaxID=90675 RepID=A0ABM0ZCN8_CAMSA|nr:PREDICTED: uncharacterized protein LOC104789922 isoform X2 [Camelina sativa]
MSKFEDEDGKPSTIVWWRPMKPTREEASLAETLVFWDISKFPVPSTFDAGRVGPTIKRFLELDGYCGNLTINAVGILTDVPPCILQALSSTGINLYHSPHGTSDIRLLISQWISKNLPPANILGICDPRGFPPPLTGFNLFRPFSYFSPEEDALLWGSSLRTVSMTTGEDMFSETNDSASWFCLTCKQLGGQGHESFSKHLSGRKHSQGSFSKKKST